MLSSSGYGRITIPAASVMDQFYERIDDADVVSAVHKAGHKVCQSVLCRGTQTNGWTDECGVLDCALVLKTAEHDVSRNYIYT